MQFKAFEAFSVHWFAAMGGFSKRWRCLKFRGWRFGRSLKVHRSQDAGRVSGLTLMLAMACQHNAQHQRGQPLRGLQRAPHRVRGAGMQPEGDAASDGRSLL
jgi:hypothetical protein